MSRVRVPVGCVLGGGLISGSSSSSRELAWWRDDFAE